MVLGFGVAVAGPAAVASAAPPFDTLEYVALGDSYSAGFGLFPVVTGTPDGCFRAEDNYPHRVAAALGITDANFQDVTCSGAVTENISTAPGQVTMPPFNVGPLPIQGAALSATTDIVTVTIGGNDLGFADVAEDCIVLKAGLGPIINPSLDNCREHFVTVIDGHEVDQLAFKIETTVTLHLIEVFDYIKAQAPNAKVFVVGYPQIAPSAAAFPNGCYSPALGPTDFQPPYPVNSVPFTTVDTHYLHNIEDQLDDAIHAAATSHGFTFVPTWDASAEHTLCAGDDSYIFGISFTNQTGPTILPTPLPGIGVYVGALHPDDGGVAFMTSLVTSAIQGHPAFGAEAAPKPQLAATGVDGAPLALAGLGIALTGLLLMVARRRVRS